MMFASRQSIEFLAYETAIIGAKNDVRAYGQALVRSDITEDEVIFLAKAFRAAKASLRRIASR